MQQLGFRLGVEPATRNSSSFINSIVRIDRLRRLDKNKNLQIHSPGITRRNFNVLQLRIVYGKFLYGYNEGDMFIDFKV